MRRSPLIPLLAAIVIVFVGCASLSPRERESLRGFQGLVDSMTQARGMPAIPVRIAALPPGAAGAYVGDAILVSRDLVRNAHDGYRSLIRPLLAHEVGHAVGGHTPMTCTAELYCEEEANEAAVHLLSAFGLSESEAVSEVVRWLLVSAVLGIRPIGVHRASCDEVSNVLLRFPGRIALTGYHGECEALVEFAREELKRPEAQQKK